MAKPKMDTIESSYTIFAVSNTTAVHIPDFGIIKDVTGAVPKIQNVSSKKEPNFFTITMTVLNTVNDEPTISATTVSKTAVTIFEIVIVQIEWTECIQF